MKLIRHNDPKEFYQLVEPLLTEHEAENNLPIGLLNAMQHGEFMETPPYLAAVEDAGKIVLMALRTPPYNLYLSFPPSTQPEPVEMIAEDVYKTFGTLTGMLSQPENAAHFIPRWEALSGQKAVAGMRQRIYKLHEVKPVKGVAGKMRRANADERDLLVDWFEAFNQEAMGISNRQQAEMSVERILNAAPEVRMLFIWEVDGAAVSMCAYTGPTPNGFRVNAVYTPPEYRRKGYASACVAEISQYILDMGRKFCFLFTDLANPTSNHIYQEIGYYEICDLNETRFEGPA